MRRIAARHTRGLAPGTAMTEMLLALPILMVVLSLVLYIGQMEVRVQKSLVMARYETWRSVTDGSGPASVPGSRNRGLARAFLGSDVDTVQQYLDDTNFATRGYDWLVDAGYEKGEEVGYAMQDLFFGPFDPRIRFPEARDMGFEVTYETSVPLWEQVDGPVRREFLLADGDWAYVRDWRAGYSQWDSDEQPRGDVLRGMRDAFWRDWDAELDAMDGVMPAEYGSYPTGPQVPNPNTLAGFVRMLYLDIPPYVGPETLSGSIGPTRPAGQ